jgi:hypothetical protein
MNDPWYQPRLVTFIAAILLMAGFVAMNTMESNKGILRVYLDESERMCVAYQGRARGWPQTYSVRYVLDEKETTLLGYPKRKFVDDVYNSKQLWINVLIGIFGIASSTLILESTVRLIARRPKKVQEEPRRRIASTIQPAAEEEPAAKPVARNASRIKSTKSAIIGPSSTKAAIVGAKTPGRPLTSKQNAKPAPRPASIKQKPKVEETSPRPASVKPALASRRQEELKKLVKS